MLAVGLLALFLGARTLLDPSRTAQFLADLTDRLDAWTYGLVGVMALAETGAFVGLVAPGETVVVVGGLAAQHGQVSLPAIALIAWARRRLDRPCAQAGFPASSGNSTHAMLIKRRCSPPCAARRLRHGQARNGHWNPCHRRQRGGIVAADEPFKEEI